VQALQVLNFSRHVQLRSVAEADAAAACQAALAAHAARTLALAVGRGALTLSTVSLLPTEPLTAHKFVLHGARQGVRTASTCCEFTRLCSNGALMCCTETWRVAWCLELHVCDCKMMVRATHLLYTGRLPHKSNAAVAYDLSAQPPAPSGGAECDLTAWPEFHAGAAGGLRITPSASRLVRTWLLLRKPPVATYSHAGTLFALGLRGELRPLAAGNLYRYLSQEHLATTIGVLLGLGASYRGCQAR
jgi:hypothetical protein